ncbi:tyrosine-type recombinase/integrase [Demequina activiva]|uniref:Site-specific integrase n=1 Tax=Demequina activiva TaxID=1582364 RepID=A0A919ULA9_9MICO|nr:tyrosine-type recombinase/integrase [Demequina activiva]GIG54538.1 site-specific integrase [Demequina activiva]
MIYRRCACRTADGRAYANLPEHPSPQQLQRACPALVAAHTSGGRHGKWGFYLSRGFDSRGRRLQTRSANFDTRSAALKAFASAKHDHDRGSYVENSRTRFAAWLDDWLSSRIQRGDLKPSTVQNYRRYIDQDIKDSPLGAMRVTDIRRSHIRQFIDDLGASGRGATTIRRIVAVVQGSLTAAVHEDLISTNPARGVKLPTVGRHDFEPWSPAQIGAFLDSAAADRLGPLFEFAVFTGLRRGELLGLRWEDVDVASYKLQVRRTRIQTERGVLEQSPKTTSGRRIVDLDEAAVGCLMEWQLRQQSECTALGATWSTSGYVFTSPAGDPLLPQYVTRLFDRIRNRAQLPKMTFHGLRHEHASLLIESGADIALISKRLGHSSIGITSDVYSHLIGDAARKAAGRASALVPRERTAQRVHNEQ